MTRGNLSVKLIAIAAAIIATLLEASSALETTPTPADLEEAVGRLSAGVIGFVQVPSYDK